MVHLQLGSLLLETLAEEQAFDGQVSGWEETLVTERCLVCDWTLGGVQQGQAFLHKLLMHSVKRQVELSSGV